MYKVQFGNYNSYDDFGLYLTNLAIGEPNVKSNYVNIPARDGQIDLSGVLSDYPIYDMRTITYSFVWYSNADDFEADLRQISNALHGKTMDVVHDDDSYYWHGKITVQNPQLSGEKASVTISLYADPYALKNEITSVTTALNTASASGEIASFDDGGDGMPASSLVANIEAVQNLKGYDHPWVGGAGKNLSPATVSDATACISQYGNAFQNGVAGGSFSVNGNTITITRLNSSYAIFFCVGQCKANEQMTLSFDVTEGYVYDIDVRTLPPSDAPNNDYRIYRDTTVAGLSHVKRTFTVEQDGYVYIEFYNTNSSILTAKFSNIQFEKGSTATAYEPYENICPISGWDNVSLFVRGKNLIYPNILSRTTGGVTYIANSDGSFTVNGTATPGVSSLLLVQDSSKLNFKCGQKYYWGFSGGDGTLQIQLYTDGVFRKTTTGSNVSFTIPENTTYSYIRFRVGAGESVSCTVYPYCYLEDSTEYEKQLGDNYAIPLDSTYYGGTLDVTTGVLTVTHLKKKVSDFTWTYASGISSFRSLSSSSSGAESALIPADGLGQVYGQAYCSHYEIANVSTSSDMISAKNKIAIGSSVSIYRLLINDPSFNGDASAFKSAMGDCEIVYELATPQTVQLSTQQVQTVLKKNNIWADSGNVSITYYQNNHIEINGDKPVIPTFNLIGADATAKVTCGDASVTFAGGKHRFADIVVGGSNDAIDVSGNGNLTTTYQEGVL